MADTETTEKGAVTHGLRRVGSLPSPLPRKGGGGNRIFEPMLQEVRETVEKEAPDNENVYQEWFSLGEYSNATACSAAANFLRKKHGDRVEVKGWAFKPLRVDENTSVLFVRHDPTAVKKGAENEWQQRIEDNKVKFADRAAKIQATRARNKAAAEKEKAATSGGDKAGSRGMGRG